MEITLKDSMMVKVMTSDGDGDSSDGCVRCVCVCVCVYSLSQSAAGLSRDIRPSPYGKSSELIVTNLWVGSRPLTHNTPGQRGLSLLS